MHLAACFAGVLVVGHSTANAGEGSDDWPNWRGPLCTGASTTANPPIFWSENENIRWKVAVPGRGHASPIVWGDHVFVLTAERTGEPLVKRDAPEEGAGAGRRLPKITPDRVQQFAVMALEREDGSVAWRSVAAEGVPHEETHGVATWASASAVTDGEHLFAHFGSNGLFGYNLAGEKLWELQLGKMETRNGFGEGSSPSVHGDMLVVQWDHEGPSFIVALDKRTGEVKWRRERDEPTSWATPLIVEVDGRAQVVTAGTNRVRSYDLATGEVVWESRGLTPHVVPSPVEVNGAAYFMSGFRGSACVAVELAKAEGDISGSDAVLWRHDHDTPYVPSPLALNGILYFFKSNSGIFSALDLVSGDSFYGPVRLEKIRKVNASPVGAAGRVYLVGREGTTEVVAQGPMLKVLATNVLDGAFYASPALAGDELYLRGTSHLYCIADR
jgi:outer membrane protein assembly factor BamB